MFHRLRLDCANINMWNPRVNVTITGCKKDKSREIPIFASFTECQEYYHICWYVGPQSPSINDSEQHKICRSADFEALELWNVWSGFCSPYSASRRICPTMQPPKFFPTARNDLSQWPSCLFACPDMCANLVYWRKTSKFVSCTHDSCSSRERRGQSYFPLPGFEPVTLVLKDKRLNAWARVTRSAPTDVINYAGTLSEIKQTSL